MMSKTVMSPMKTGRGTAPTRLGRQPEGRVPAGRGMYPVVSGSGMLLFVFPKSQSPAVRGLFCNGPPGSSCHDSLIVREGRRHIDAVRRYLVFSQAFVMVASSHFHYDQCLLNRGFDFHEFQKDDAVYEKAQSNLGDGKRAPACLVHFPQQERTQLPCLELPDQSVCLLPQLIFSHVHGKVA